MLTVCWFKSITDGADYLFMRILKCLYELPSAASAVVLAISAKSFLVCGFLPHVVQYVHIHIWQKWEKIAQHFLWQPDSDRTMTECHNSIFPSYHQFCMTPQHTSTMCHVLWEHCNCTGVTKMAAHKVAAGSREITDNWTEKCFLFLFVPWYEQNDDKVWFDLVSTTGGGFIIFRRL